ncbi:MAG: hypothetical protein PHE83_18030 [Opitutaceae bacterium]|nr:hypothetical protein [Opitutaceae bacterium]
MSLHPLPASNLPLLRGDFPEEIGILLALQQRVLDLPAKPGMVVRRHLPPSLPAAEYARLARWVRLPERVAYLEGIPAGQLRPILWAMILPTYGVAVEAHPMWSALAEEIRRHTQAAPGPLPFQHPGLQTPLSKPDFPTHGLVHDRPSGRLALVPKERVGSYLCHAFRWAVPHALVPREAAA